MTTEQLKEFTEETIPQQLFHVDPTDIDDDSGGRLDEVILVGLIANSPSCLKYKPLQWFLDTFLIKNGGEEISEEIERQFLQGDMVSTDDFFDWLQEDEKNYEDDGIYWLKDE